VADFTSPFLGSEYSQPSREHGIFVSYLERSVVAGESVADP
jgi:hypothetical protein